MLTILEGSTFCVSDDLGDVNGETNGFFAWDTRFLSKLVLRVNDESPLQLSAGRLQHFAAAFYLRNPRVDGLPTDSLSTSPASTVVIRIGRPSKSSRSAYTKPRTANFDATYDAPFW